MSDPSISDLASKYREIIGIESPSEVWEVEKGHIRMHADAVGDTNPLWRDEEYARTTQYGTIIAPPFLLIDAGLVKFVDKLVDMAPDMANINGGTEVDFYGPMKVGDVITSVAKLLDVKEKSGKSGDMIFLTVEVAYTNQTDELVTRSRTTFIRR